MAHGYGNADPGDRDVEVALAMLRAGARTGDIGRADRALRDELTRRLDAGESPGGVVTVLADGAEAFGPPTASPSRSGPHCRVLRAPEVTTTGAPQASSRHAASATGPWCRHPDTESAEDRLLRRSWPRRSPSMSEPTPAEATPATPAPTRPGSLMPTPTSPRSSTSTASTSTPTSPSSSPPPASASRSMARAATSKTTKAAGTSTAWVATAPSPSGIAIPRSWPPSRISSTRSP